ncbi:MAG: di-trans,poly-cis-decaprenylcistransferase [Parcubacteria group bacterium]|nr:di-trans,poly-cis-decaprenylcistransferase [Parcubacteria group bacterium]
MEIRSFEEAPQCIGVILDGNRRGGGHFAGYKKFKEFLGWARDAGVTHVIAYVFSTENWQRSEEEVALLMDLFRRALGNEIDELCGEGVRLSILGDQRRLPKDIKKLVKKAEKKTEKNGLFHLGLALSYGGRADIFQAALSFMAQWGHYPHLLVKFQESDFEKHLSSRRKGFPDPDFILRTGGEIRLSNFLLWESAYSELIFRDTLWPDFTKEEFQGVLAEYARRKRNFGK